MLSVHAMCAKKTMISRSASSLAALLRPELKSIEEAGTWKNERIIASAQRTKITLVDGSEVLNFCSNNYLGLAVKFPRLTSPNRKR